MIQCVALNTHIFTNFAIFFCTETVLNLRDTLCWQSIVDIAVLQHSWRLMSIQKCKSCIAWITDSSSKLRELQSSAEISRNWILAIEGLHSCAQKNMMPYTVKKKRMVIIPSSVYEFESYKIPFSTVYETFKNPQIITKIPSNIRSWKGWCRFGRSTIDWYYVHGMADATIHGEPWATDTFLKRLMSSFIGHHRLLIRSWRSRCHHSWSIIDY